MTAKQKSFPFPAGTLIVLKENKDDAKRPYAWWSDHHNTWLPNGTMLLILEWLDESWGRVDGTWGRVDGTTYKRSEAIVCAPELGVFSTIGDDEFWTCMWEVVSFPAPAHDGTSQLREQQSV